MDSRQRPYTASGPGAAINDRVSYNLNRAESLLEEPDAGFSIGNFGGGMNMGGSGIGSGMGSGFGRA